MPKITVNYTRPYLTPYQEEALFNDSRYVWCVGSTKSGKTVSSIVWLTEQALLIGGLNKHFWWVAPSIGQTLIAYKRLKSFLAQDNYTSNDTSRTITLFNGAVLEFKTADDPDKLFGEDVYACVVDEASRCREEAFHAVRSTLTATRGKIRLIGNHKGRSNFFYRGCMKAQAGLENHKYAEMNSAMAIESGIIEEAEVADAKATLPEAVFNELYLNLPCDEGTNPFGLKHITECATYLSNGIKQPRQLSTLPVVCFGVDLGRSVDYTSITGLDQYGAVCIQIRFKEDWEFTTQKILDVVGSTPTLVDSTGVGDVIAERLHKARHSITGFHFSSTSKQTLMENLALGIQNGQVKIPYEGPMRLELEAYEYEYTRTGIRYMSKIHDDTVCSLALAYKYHTKPRNNFLWDLYEEDNRDESKWPPKPHPLQRGQYEY